MRNDDRKYTFTPNKISSKIPVEIKNLVENDKKSNSRDSKDNLHIANILQRSNFNNIPKVNKSLIKISKKTSSLKDILKKNAETTKIKNGNPHSPCLSPKEGNKKSVRESSNISNDIKFVNNPPESKINKQSPIVSHEKIFEKNKSAPKHFNISLVYNKDIKHNRKFSEGNLDIINMNEKSVNKGTKTTKDSSFTSQKLNNIKTTNLEVESIEELHFIYNNLYHQNKSLAFKFENLEMEEEILNEGGKSIYIN